MQDKVEEKRLKRVGVLRDLLEGEQDLEILTTRFVHDWRIKTRRFKSGKRTVARDFANAKRDDIHSPTSSTHARKHL